MSDLISEEDAARRLDCSVKTLSRYRRDGEIGFVAIAGRIYYTQAQIEAFIAARSIPAKATA